MSKTDKPYDPDGKNRSELAKLKKAFISDTAKRLKKKVRFYRTSETPGGSLTAYYFIDEIFKLKERLPWKARVLHQWGTFMLTLETAIHPNDIKKNATGRVYVISLSDRCDCIPYRCQTEYSEDYFKIYVYGRTIEDAIKWFWEDYDAQIAKLSSCITLI